MLREHPSTAPLSLDAPRERGWSAPTDNPFGWRQSRWARRIPRAWLGLSGYVAGGVLLGLLLIAGLALVQRREPAPSAGVVTDNVVRLHASEIGASCWRGAAAGGSAHLNVSLDVGLDGKVRRASAAGESPALRACVEAHVAGWEFLPQARPSVLVLPVEVDRR